MPELYAADALLPGHPDRVCDLVADALVDAATARDPAARCDVAVVRLGDAAHVGGRLPDLLDAEAVVRGHFPDGPRLVVATTPEGTTGHVVAVGYAIDEPGTNYLPAEFWLAARLATRLGRVAPAGELIVLLEEEAHPTRLAGFSCSLGVEGPTPAVQRAVRSAVQEELSQLARRVPGFDSTVPESLAVQPFAPPTFAASGRRVAASLYGPRVPTPGPGLSGKDLAHPARGGAIYARRLAKAVVRAGVARECRAVVTFVPGLDDGVIVSLHGDGRRLDASRWGDLLERSPARLAARYTGKVALAEVARAGHFLSEDWPWEGVRFEG